MMSFGYYRGTTRIEWWWIEGSFVQIEFDSIWFSKSGSINDLKQMAKEKANGKS